MEPAKINTFVLPGQQITIKAPKRTVSIGPGLMRTPEATSLTVTRAGILRYRAANVYWIENMQNRYVPKSGDQVIGVVQRKAADFMRLHLGNGEAAMISAYAFEGATKKQKADVRVGDLIYAKLTNAHREMPAEAVCVNRYFKAKRFGKLGAQPVAGAIRMPIYCSVQLLKLHLRLLAEIARREPFEMAIGVNGRAWLHAQNVRTVKKVSRAMRMMRQHPHISRKEACKRVRSATRKAEMWAMWT